MFSLLKKKGQNARVYGCVKELNSYPPWPRSPIPSRFIAAPPSCLLGFLLGEAKVARHGWFSLVNTALAVVSPAFLHLRVM